MNYYIFRMANAFLFYAKLNFKLVLGPGLGARLANYVHTVAVVKITITTYFSNVYNEENGSCTTICLSLPYCIRLEPKLGVRKIVLRSIDHTS